MLERIGRMLREAREAKGLSLTDIQMETNIRLAYLQALEAGAGHNAFPGDPYHRGFMKTYARAVGLSPEEVLKLYDEHYWPAEVEDGGAQGVRAAAPVAAPAEAPVPRQQHDRSLRGAQIRSPEPSHPSGARASGNTGRRAWAAVAILVLVLAAAGGTWWYFHQDTTAGGSKAGGGETPVVSSPGNTGGATAGGTGGGASGGTGGGTTSPPDNTTKPPEPPAVTVTRKDVDAENTVVSVKGADKISVTVKVTERCWFGVTQDGSVIAEETLDPGDSRTWTASKKLGMRVGNPDGATFTVNGKDQGSMGSLRIPRNITIEKAP